jgi:hypothetical protein
MANVRISDLTAASAVAAANELEINEAGTSKKVTADQILAFIKAQSEVYNASVTSQSGFSSDTYLTGSSLAIPSGRLKAKSMYKAQFNVVKTGAGVATPIINVRFGTAGTTADTSRGTLTFAAQTAVIDEGVWEIDCIFRTVGSGTSAVLHTLGQLSHRLSITGLGVGVSEPEIATSGGFDSTVASSIIGLSVNGGTSASWTVNSVRATLLNLA